MVSAGPGTRRGITVIATVVLCRFDLHRAPRGHLAEKAPIGRRDVTWSGTIVHVDSAIIAASSVGLSCLAHSALMASFHVLYRRRRGGFAPAVARSWAMPS